MLKMYFCLAGIILQCTFALDKRLRYNYKL